MGWAESCVHVHLIRHPARVIASYAAKREEVTLEDIGYAQQLDIFEQVGGVVVNSADIRADPEGALRRLCAEIGLVFDPAMLRWEAGPRVEDGVWAKHWYGSVHRSTGFAGAEGDLPVLEQQWQGLLAEAMPLYEAMAVQAIRA